ncbi:MAG: iron-sulfur cluster assembly scaffold protein [Proteobacteria bacterium]|nr:iron-sulfur cluster assembly scaffold protein [Pseudomonadota bacterium]MBI3499329.1 iron-sulfur cluster assembly scaffold protein [Pseudomonadota bacterium]
MNDRLYHDTLMEAARQATGHGRLAKPDASATVDNPLCGDRVTIDLRCEAGRIAEIAHDVRGCILCRASASVLAREAVGLDRTEAAAKRAGMEALLSDGALPATPAFEPFRPVAPYRSRHDCVLLPFRALERALGDVG